MKNGGIIDDTIVSNFGDTIGMVVNAGCKDKDEAHMNRELEKFKKDGKDVKIVWSTNSLVALQGPLAPTVLQKLTGYDISSIPFFGIASFAIAGVQCQVHR